MCEVSFCHQCYILKSPTIISGPAMCPRLANSIEKSAMKVDGAELGVRYNTSALTVLYCVMTLYTLKSRLWVIASPPPLVEFCLFAFLLALGRAAPINLYPDAVAKFPSGIRCRCYDQLYAL